MAQSIDGIGYDSVIVACELLHDEGHGFVGLSVLNKGFDGHRAGYVGVAVRADLFEHPDGLVVQERIELLKVECVYVT